MLIKTTSCLELAILLGLPRVYQIIVHNSQEQCLFFFLEQSSIIKYPTLGYSGPVKVCLPCLVTGSNSGEHGLP